MFALVAIILKRFKTKYSFHFGLVAKLRDWRSGLKNYNPKHFEKHTSYTEILLDVICSGNLHGFNALTCELFHFVYPSVALFKSLIIRGPSV